MSDAAPGRVRGARRRPQQLAAGRTQVARGARTDDLRGDLPGDVPGDVTDDLGVGVGRPRSARRAGLASALAIGVLVVVPLLSISFSLRSSPHELNVLAQRDAP